MKRTVRKVCAKPGCTEQGFYETHNAKEYREINNRNWFCTRHTREEEVLSLENNYRETVLICKEDENDRKYWSGKWGFVFGMGWKAYAKDFPTGTKIIATAKVVEPT